MLCERLSISLDHVSAESGAGIALQLWTVVGGVFGLGGTVPHFSAVTQIH